MLHKHLNTFGFTDTEQKILLHLFTQGKSIASIIAKRIGIKRTTVYAALAELVQQGFLIKSKADSVTYFSIVSVDLFTQMIQHRAREEYEKAQSSADALNTQIKRMGTNKGQQEFGAFEIQHFSSLEMAALEIESKLTKHEGRAVLNTNSVTANKKIKDLILDVVKRTGNKKAQLREIIDPSLLAKWYKSQITNKNHQVKYMPRKDMFPANVMMIDGSIYYLHFRPNNETCIKVTEPDLYKSFVNIFDAAWLFLK